MNDYAYNFILKFFSILTIQNMDNKERHSIRLQENPVLAGILSAVEDAYFRN
jgi:hypothetical protein